jgi:hypothetical protein
MEKSKFATKVSVDQNYLDEDLKSNASISYNVDCDCGSKEHSARFAFEIDEKFADISLRVWMPLYCFVHENSFFKRIKLRIKYAFQILFGKMIEVDGELLFRDSEHIQNAIDAMIEGKEKLTRIQKKLYEEYLAK